MEKYSIGLDYGTLSGRALLVRLSDGEEIGYKSFDYPHAVMESALPDGTKLGDQFALQHPQDYIDVLVNTIPGLMDEYKIKPEQVVGIGIDFTSCTVMPVLADGTPLCILDEYKSVPNAYVKLWKHHAAQYCADKINELAEKRGEEWLEQYGGKVSSEFLFPKLLQIELENPELLEKADLFVEAGDWLAWQLSDDKLYRSACMAGYKALWNYENGFPSKDFLNQLSPKFGDKSERLLKGDIVPVGTRVGGLNKKMAELLGLNEGTAIATPIIDAHSAFPAAGITEDGALLMIMGTSTCHISVSNVAYNAKGMCGIVKDGVLPGYYAYESGQACVGDHFKWLRENCVPASYAEKAKEEGMTLYEYLISLAEKQNPGENGLLALDWWNGVRTPLTDANLSGLLIGATLTTKPEDMYRALLEATAYGTRYIIENYRNSNIPVNALYACGGISKIKFIMQIYADVIGMPIKIASSTNGPALGAAIFGSLAAGKCNGGFDKVNDAVAVMGKCSDEVVIPNEKNHEVYNILFEEYCKLLDYFGQGGNNVMKALLKLKK